MDIARIIRYFIFTILLVLMAALMVLQMPKVQTALADKAISFLSDKIDADIHLERIHFKPINTIVLKNLTIIDRAPFSREASDTLIHAGTLSARFSLRSLISPEHENIIIKEVKLFDSKFYLNIDSTDYGNNLSRCFRLKKKKEDTSEPKQEKDIIAIKKIRIRNFAFCMRNFMDDSKIQFPTAINWKDLQTREVNMDASNFSIGYGLFGGTLEHLDLKEKCGWHLKHLSGEALVGKGKVDVRNMVIDDGLSHAELNYQMIGTSEDYKDFVNKVKLVADIQRGRWSLTTLSHFIPPMAHPSADQFFSISGKAAGPVCDIKAQGLRIALEKSPTTLTLYGGVSNLPDVKNMFIDAHLRGVKFRFEDIGRIMKAVSSNSKLDLSNMGAGEIHSGYFNAVGSINSLQTWGTLSQNREKGQIIFNATVSDILSGGVPPISINGELATANLNLKNLLGIDALGRTSIFTNFQASLPMGGQSALTAKIDTLNIRSAEFNGYTYRTVSGKAVLKGKDLTAHLTAHDPSLDADINITTGEKDYAADIKVNLADLKAMNIDKREVGVVRFHGKGHMDKNFSIIKGKFDLSDILLTNTTGAHHVPDMQLVATNDDGTQNFSLRSKLANADLTGKNGNYSAGLGVVDTRELLAYVIPGLYLEKGSQIDVRMDSTGFISGTIKSGRVAFNNHFARNMDARICGTLDSLHADITAANILALDYNMDNARINADWTGSRIQAKYTFDNGAPKSESDNLLDADLSAEITLGKGETAIHINPSFINTALNRWNMDESSILLKGKNITVDNLKVTSRDQSIFIDGNTSESSPAQIKAKIHNLDISIFNTILKKQNLGLKGRLTADALLSSPISGEHLPGLMMELKADSLSLGGVPFGTLEAKSILDSETDKFKFRLNDRIDGRDAIKTGIIYSPGSNDVEIAAALEKFPIAGLRGLLAGVFSDMGGSVSGRFTAKGPLKDMTLSSSGARIDDGMIEIAFTKVPYYLSGGFSLDNKGIHIDEMAVRDRLEGNGTVTGGLEWEKFKNMRLNLGMEVKNMEAINIPTAGNPLFGGNIFATGKVYLQGPFSGLVLNAACMTEPNSKLKISLSSATEASKKNLLTFVDPRIVKEEDPYQILLDKYYKKKETGGSNFALNIVATASPTMLVSLDLGDVGFAAGLTGRGKGNIGLEINPSAEQGFQMYGDYTITEGKFNVNAANLVCREFGIKGGSSIKFSGDVLKSAVNIDATYHTKASISSLIADTTSVSNRRTVICGIKVQNSLIAPDVKFSIDIPDLEPTVKSSVESALSTEDKVQKQFLSLLLSNNFIPDEQSGVVNNSSLLYANVSELMASQINNIFSRLDIPLDLGLNYQPTDRGANIFDVAVSTQLFNNRVIIGGSVGNRQSSSSNSSSLVGDLDVEIKIDQPGTIRMSLFSHSADQYTQYLDNSQRNGIGFSWQQDFDNFAKWCKSLFMTKQKKIKVVEEQLKNVQSRTTLTIDE